jgi:hypothetical protein
MNHIYRDGKVLFEDSRTTVVTFDYVGGYHETAGWGTTRDPDTLTQRGGLSGIDPSGFDFDLVYSTFKPSGDPSADYCFGGSVVFRLANPMGEHIYLKLWNLHNGTRVHQFRMEHEGRTIHFGNL